MLNILVPTDFSPLSKVAVQYAIKIANQLNGRITLLNVVTVSPSVRVSMRMKVRELYRDLFAFAERDLEALMREVSYDLQTTEPIRWNVVAGTVVRDAVVKEARRSKAGLIVMGTRGASGIKKTFLGSNTASLIEVSDIPVLAVPEHAEFRGFKDIVYASDLAGLERELKILTPYVEQFGSIIHLVHVARQGDDVGALEEKIERVVRKLGYTNIVTLVTVDQFIEGALDQYLSISKSDLLAMFTHNLNFYEKLFDKSITRKMAFHSPVPLLAFKKQ